MITEDKPCPKCGTQHPIRVGFTWWGGIVGSKMFNHVQCQQCGNTYNGQTGESNQTAIAIYVTVSSIIGILIFTAIYSNRDSSRPANTTSSIAITRERES